MAFAEFALALLVLLIAPGPTNALLALAGGESGWRAGSRMIPVVLGCYLVVVIPLALWGGGLLADVPLLRQGLTAVAAVWVAILAIRLWRQPQAVAATAGNSRMRAMAVTTLLNPKALIFGLVLIPSAPSTALGLAVFAALVPATSLAWLGIGAGLRSSHAVPMQKGAAVWLALVAMVLFSKLLA